MLESDVARLAAVCISVVGLGLVAGTSPTFYALVLRVLSHEGGGREGQGRRPLGLLLVGYATGTTLLASLCRSSTRGPSRPCCVAGSSARRSTGEWTSPRA